MDIHAVGVPVFQKPGTEWYSQTWAPRFCSESQIHQMFSLIVGESTYSLPVRFACSTIFDLSPITTRFQDASVSLSLVGSYHTANVCTFVLIRHGRHEGQRPDWSQSVQGLGTSYSHLRIPFSSFLAKFMLQHLDLTQSENVRRRAQSQIQVDESKYLFW